MSLRSGSDSPTLLATAEGNDEMHRSYQSILPCQNKLLQKRWDKTYYDEHRRKLANVAPVVDTRPPQTFMHLHLKLKKLQLEEDRLDIIERDNRILLEKMAYIMRTKGRVDNYHDYRNKSLNAEKREREQLRISVENKNILRRILSRQPVYSHRAWLEDWNKNRNLLNNISHFPNEWWKTSKSYDKRMPSDSFRNGRNMGSQATSHRKDDDDYSLDYETEDEKDTTVDTNRSQRSEVTKERHLKAGEKKKGGKSEGKNSVTKTEENKHFEERETKEDEKREQEKDKMEKESLENLDDSETDAAQS